MLRPGFVLRTDHHFQVAVHNQLPVVVWQHGRVINYGGPIERVTENAVWINGEGYLKATCEFKVR